MFGQINSAIICWCRLGCLFSAIAGLLILSLLGARAHGYEGAGVFVGAEACGACHDGPGMNHQHSRWLLSAHATAYAALAKPEAKEIARISGVPVEPTKSPLCLGCHATASHAESWEKDVGFFLVEGVQCEACHGPGSEYMDADIMRNRELAMKKGLRIPTKDDCMACHNVKGSHVAVLKSPAFDTEKAWQELAHPTPEEYSWQVERKLPDPISPGTKMPKYTGVRACAACHDGPAMNYQYSVWRMSKHASAYASLSTPRARQIAAEWGVEDDPQASPRCLQCHTTAYHHPAGGFLESFALTEGVGCEACHGAGSDYSPEAIMRDPRAARLAGLQEVTEQTCLACHANAHGKPFDYLTAVKLIAHPTRPVETHTRAEPRYKTPKYIAVHPQGHEAWVSCEASNSVIVLDLSQRRRIAEIPVGSQPNDLAFSPDGRWVYVSCRMDDTLSIIDALSRTVTATVSVGDEPHGVQPGPAGDWVMVLNTASEDISVIELDSLKEIKRLKASRSPWAAALSPDKSLILVTHVLPKFGPFRGRLMSEVTMINAERAIVEHRLELPDANLGMGIAWHPSNRFALMTTDRTKSNVPMTRLLQGWTITNGIAVIWRDGRSDQLLLDEPTMGMSDPTDIVITPDGRWALVSSSGTDRVAVLDIEKMLAIIESADPYERQHILPNHHGYPTEFVVKHIATGASPKGLAITPDGRWVLVAESLDDTVGIIDAERMELVGRIDLGGPKVITKARFGERLFHSANITFRRQFSCQTCHPDGHVDGITYDIEPDGIGASPVDNRTLRGILDTAPFKWEGTNPSLARQCGARLSVFFTRLQPFNPEELSAVDYYLSTIPRPPNRYRPLGGPLTDAQRRGRDIFYRTHTNDGREIPKENRCVTCHFPPLYTDRQLHDVGTRMWLDRQGKFDTPHLNNIYDSAPYLHNGIAPTLEEIWTRFNPDDRHGVTNDMTKDQLNDLIEFLKTL